MPEEPAGSQQRAEWCAVLRAEPANPEAISALKLRPFLGTLMTPAEIEQAKTEMREIVRAADNWKGEIVRWRGEAERGDARLPATVSARVAGAVRPAELVALERILWQQRRHKAFRAMLLALLPALGENPSPAAAASFARYAVFSTFDDVPHGRSRRAETPRAGPLRHAVSRGASLAAGSAGVGRWPRRLLHRLPGGRAGRPPALLYAQRLSVGVAGRQVAGDARSCGEPITGSRVNTAAFARQRKAAALLAERDAAIRELNRDTSAFLDSVDLANAVIRQRNERITFAPAATDRGRGRARAFVVVEVVVGGLQRDVRCHQRRRSADGGGEAGPRLSDVWRLRVRRPVLLFCAGTKVWTMTGRRPIEGIKVGDCVLAQDVESGELAYKPVLGVTIRPAPPTMKMRTGAE